MNVLACLPDTRELILCSRCGLSLEAHDSVCPECGPYVTSALCRIRSGRREYRLGANWLTQPESAEMRADWTVGRGEFLVPAGELHLPDIQTAEVLRCDGLAIEALRDWEASSMVDSAEGRGLTARCSARVRRALAEADRAARGGA